MPSPPPAFAAGTFGAGIAQRHHTNALLSSFNVGRTRSPVAARTRRRLGGRPPPPPPHHRRARHPPAFLSRALAADSDDSDADATPDSSGASASDLGTPRLPPTEEARRRELADDRVTEMRVRFPRQVGSDKMAIAFTCKRCETRMQKTFSRQAYYHGVVLVTCAGCCARHLIADNLGWYADLLQMTGKESGHRIEDWLEVMRVDSDVFVLERAWHAAPREPRQEHNDDNGAPSG